MKLSIENNGFFNKLTMDSVEDGGTRNG